MFNNNFLIVTNSEIGQYEAKKVHALCQRDDKNENNDLIDNLYSDCLQKQIESKVVRPMRGYLHQVEDELLDSDTSSVSDDSLEDFLRE